MIEWTEFTRAGKRVTKQKSFCSKEEEDKYVAKLMKKASFCEVISGR